MFAAAVIAGCGSAWADIPASAYVQDGLLAQWDGIENAGLGQPHDPSAAYPQELVSGIAQTLTGTMVAGDNYFTLGSGFLTFKLPAMIAAINAGDATVEMRISRDTSVGLVGDAGFVGFGSTSPKRAFWLWQSKSDFVSGYSYHAKDGEYDSTLKYNESSTNTLAFQLGATANDSAGSASTSAPGTVYLSYADTAEKAGEIIIDNLGGSVEYARNTKAGAVLTSQFGDQPEDFKEATIRIGPGAGLTISADMRVKDVSLESASSYLVIPTPATEEDPTPVLTIESLEHKYGIGWIGKTLPVGTGTGRRKKYDYIKWMLPGLMLFVR